LTNPTSRPLTGAATITITFNNQNLTIMKSLSSLKTKLESVKKLTTAEKIVNEFRENTEIDFNFEFRGVNVYAGNDSIAIFVNGLEKFTVTYDKPIFFN
jgi:hypothetical protein